MENNTSTELQSLNKRYAVASTQLADPLSYDAASNELVRILLDYLSFFCESTNLDDFLRTLKKLSSFNKTYLTDFVLNKIAWESGSILQSAALPEHKFQMLESYFQILEQFEFHKPSKGYSRLLSGILYYGKSWTGFLTFVNWWGWGSFSKQDFEKNTKGELVFPSLAERVTNAFGKNIFAMINEEALPPAMAKDLLIPYDTYLSKLESNKINFDFAPYYHAKALKQLGQKEKAQQVFLDFAKKKKRDFWVWDLLGDLQEEPQIRLACQLKGLSCPGPPSFKVGLMEKAILTLVQQEYQGWAKFEIQKLIQLRQKNKWSIPKNIQDLQQEDWFENTPVKLDDKKLKKLLLVSEQLLEEVKSEDILVSRILASKGLITGITKDNLPYIAPIRGSGTLPKTGDACHISFVKNERGQSVIFDWIKIPTKEWMNSSKKVVQGELKQMPGKDFGFVSDVFIPPDLLKSHKSHGDLTLKVNAVKSYEPSKKKWSWMAFEIYNT
ncbi:DUF7017 domain-containing protein [Algoriphagus chordae]|uniref:TOTE conflict systems S1/CSD-like domain-containing protein n=1 Tax=Algoriphagus chordae TaxID=237019 RepID=A0A2W7QBF8_9BACT|nr:hypothetical protein [Algoriphagus chordae]PZX45994.1 hypothetical protein LV85_04400 [Algoriphagus chordae]